MIIFESVVVVVVTMVILTAVIVFLGMIAKVSWLLWKSAGSILWRRFLLDRLGVFGTVVVESLAIIIIIITVMTFLVITMLRIIILMKKVWRLRTVPSHWRRHHW